MSNIRDYSFERSQISSDIIMYHCGMESCAPSHSYGPAVRDYYLFHFVISGRGVFQKRNVEYVLEAGQGFLICPDEVTFYQADSLMPWEYVWVGFKGIKAAHFLKLADLSEKTPIFTPTNSYDSLKFNMLQMVDTAQLYLDGRDLRLLGHLYVVLSELINLNHKSSVNVAKTTSIQDIYIQRAVELINMNYSKKLSITKLAATIGLDRSYLSELFSERLNCSPQKYLIDIRINKACELLKNQELSIGDVSRSVGYDDPLCFSKVFKKLKGICPKDYRSRLFDPN